MQDTIRKFPDGFLWGAATASYQVEGGIPNCDWAQGAREGKVPECGRACDHYNRYEEDFDIAKALGHKVHRFSVEWARIEPEEGKFNEKAIEHYRAVVRALRMRDIEPQVTLWHFTLPQWFSERGGWEHASAPAVFARYCDFVANAFADEVIHFATINEPMVVAGIGYLRGAWPPFHKRAFLKYLRVLRNMQKGHNTAYLLIKKHHPELSVGIVKHTIPCSSNGNPVNRFRAFLGNLGWTRLFMHGVYKQCDWIGLNYYKHRRYGDTRKLPVTDFGWRIDPYIGTHLALHELWRYKKPIYVTEAGCSDAKDAFRAEYIRDTARAIHQAIAEGVDVRAYCYWSLLDNYEWAEGFTQRFGLVEIDYDTMKRHIRQSAYVYKEICEKNAVSA
jgi:beta-glucosidase